MPIKDVDSAGIQRKGRIQEVLKKYPNESGIRRSRTNINTVTSIMFLMLELGYSRCAYCQYIGMLDIVWLCSQSDWKGDHHDACERCAGVHNSGLM